MATGVRQEAAVASGAITVAEAAEKVTAVEATVDAPIAAAEAPPDDGPPASGGSDG